MATIYEFGGSRDILGCVLIHIIYISSDYHTFYEVFDTCIMHGHLTQPTLDDFHRNMFSAYIKCTSQHPTSWYFANYHV